MPLIKKPEITNRWNISSIEDLNDISFFVANNYEQYLDPLNEDADIETQISAMLESMPGTFSMETSRYPKGTFSHIRINKHVDPDDINVFIEVMNNKIESVRLVDGLNLAKNIIEESNIAQDSIGHRYYKMHHFQRQIESDGVIRMP
jgi:hypothetical protein